MFDDLQRLAETDINVAGLLALFLVLAAFGFILWQWKRTPSKSKPSEQDIAKILAETLGGIIANELEKVANSVRDDQQTNTKEHQGIVNALNQHGEIMERVAQTIVTHNEKSELFRESIGQLVGQLSNNLGKTNEVVQVMNTDIDKIKSDLADLKSAVDDIQKRIGQSVPLDKEGLELMRQVIQSVKKLEDQLPKATQATKESPKPKTEVKSEKEQPNEQSTKPAK